MNVESQLLFLFSAIGALNGFLLSVYFAFFTKSKGVSKYFLAALLLVVSVRILKSVFFFFNPGLSQFFIQIGLSALVLIGPFLFLYVKAMQQKENLKGWPFHIVPVLLLITVLGIVYPYVEYRPLWRTYIITGIYLFWLVYMIFTTVLLKDLFRKLFSRNHGLHTTEIWTLSVFVGIFLIWLGYRIGSYTSYIVGALSFSFIFFLLILFWVFKRANKPLFFEEMPKYGSKKIAVGEAKEFGAKLARILVKEESFKKANLRLPEVAKALDVSPHYLSQYLNDNLGKSFSAYINEYRVEAAKTMLKTADYFTTEAIGKECGFNSNTTFYAAFKEVTGMTPAKFRKRKA